MTRLCSERLSWGFWGWRLDPFKRTLEPMKMLLV